jgi:hypothetical protein
MPIDSIIRRIIRRMPVDIGVLYRRLTHAGNISIGFEREVEPALEWIDNHGREAGFRVPTAHERARATGRYEYLDALCEGSDMQLYNVVGNHFDPDALSCRIYGPLRTLLEGPRDARHAYLEPADLAGLYYGLAREVGQQTASIRGQEPTPIPVRHSPFPDDLSMQLMATFTRARPYVGHEQPPPQDRGPLAAEDGRGAR